MLGSQNLRRMQQEYGITLVRVAVPVVEGLLRLVLLVANPWCTTRLTTESKLQLGALPQA